MRYEDLKLPTEVEVEGRVFAISRIPALAAIPLYDVICDTYVQKGVLGLTRLPLATQKALLGFCAYKNDAGEWAEFATDTRINNCFERIDSLELLLLRLIKENFGFLTDGSLLEKLVEADPLAKASGS